MKTERTPEQEAVYQQFFAEATDLILEGNRRISEATSKETTFCGPGCSSCCCHLFFVHPVAFEVILNKIASDSLLRQRFEKNNSLRKALIEEHKVKIDEISKIEIRKQQTFEWNKLHIPCALLHEDKCMLYEFRPFICAMYITLSPPRVCAIDPKGYSTPAIQAVQNAFYLALRDLQVKYNMPGDYMYDLSWHLDHYLNPPQQEAVKKRKKS